MGVHTEGQHRPPSHAGDPLGAPRGMRIALGGPGSSPRHPPQIARGASRPTRCREPRPGGPGAGSPAAGGGRLPRWALWRFCAAWEHGLLEGRRLAGHKGQQGAAILQGGQRRPRGVPTLCCAPWRAPEETASPPSSSPQQLTFFFKGGFVGGPVAERTWAAYASQGTE